MTLSACGTWLIMHDKPSVNEQVERANFPLRLGGENWEIKNKSSKKKDLWATTGSRIESHQAVLESSDVVLTGKHVYSKYKHLAAQFPNLQGLQSMSNCWWLFTRWSLSVVALFLNVDLNQMPVILLTELQVTVTQSVFYCYSLHNSYIIHDRMHAWSHIYLTFLCFACTICCWMTPRDSVQFP